jgi:hypothetical protein
MPTVPLPTITDVYEVTTFGSGESFPIDHVIHWNVASSGGDTAGICVALAKADGLKWIGNMGPQLPPWYSHTSSRAIYLGDRTTLEAIHAGGGAGTNSVTFGARFDAVTVRHTSPTRGKGKDGRTNFPGPPTSAMSADHGKIAAPDVAEYQLLWDSFVSDVQASVLADTGLQCHLVIARRKLGSFERPLASLVDAYPNVHRRWAKKLSRHR